MQRTELAARIGCAVVTLQKIELDERRPSRQIAERLAEQPAIPPRERETFVRVARGALPVDRLALCRGMPLLTIITTGLEGLAMVAAARGQPLRTARLCGAEALREMTDEWRWQSYQQAYDRALAEARTQVSAADWTTTWGQDARWQWHRR